MPATRHEWRHLRARYHSLRRPSSTCSPRLKPGRRTGSLRRPGAVCDARASDEPLSCGRTAVRAQSVIRNDDAPFANERHEDVLVVPQWRHLEAPRQFADEAPGGDFIRQQEHTSLMVEGLDGRRDFVALEAAQVARSQMEGE